MKIFWLLGFLALVLTRCVYGSAEWSATEVAFMGNAAAAANPLLVPLTLVPSAAAKGAVCLDGTLPGYHLHHGYGSGAKSWLIQLEGGGWCNDIGTCVFRKKTRRGSSNYMEKVIQFTGILSNKRQENPDFFNWNRVKVRYCDGASFTGEGYNKAAGLFFRGQRIWAAVMDDLMSKGMRNAHQALLSGCSAGGVASILHCDEFRALLPRSTKVKCLADAGLFLDAVDVAGGRTLRTFFEGVVNLQGVAKNLPASCMNHMDATSVMSILIEKIVSKVFKETKQCFFPQNLLSHIQTPTFLLNAAYDVWQLQESLAPRRADPRGYWQQCKLNNANCNAGQIRFLQGFRNQMLNIVRGFSMSRENGLFINSCFAHCQTERQDTWFARDSPHLGNKAIATWIGNWYFDRAGAKAIDCAYPCDKTCHNLVFSQASYNYSYLPSIHL